MRYKPRILIIEDDEQVRKSLADTLRSKRREVLATDSEAAALQLAREYHQAGDEFHVVVLNLRFSPAALHLTEQIRDLHAHVRFIVISSLVSDPLPDDLRQQFEHYSVYDWLPKPSVERLRRSVDRAAEHVSTEIERDRTRRDLVDCNVEKRRLRDDSQRAIRSLEKRLHGALERLADSRQHAADLVDIGEDLVRARDLQVLLRSADENMRATVPCETSLIYFLNSLPDKPEPFPLEAGGDLGRVFRYVRHREHDEDREEIEAIGFEVARQVATTGRIIRMTDLEELVRSVLGVPVMDDEHGVIGVVILFNRLADGGARHPSGFSEVDEIFIDRIARFCAQGALRQYDTGLDPLTRLPNRRDLTETFEKVMSRLFGRRRSVEPRLWLAVADIDHFGMYNKRFGLLVGDMVLRDVADTLQKSVRDYVSRYGGEEFVFLLQDLEDDTTKPDEEPDGDPDAAAEKPRVAGVLEVLERARERVEALWAPEHEEMPVTVSIGVTRVCPEDSLETALKRANSSLQDAKDLGRNRVRWAPWPC
jgi:GGDEF domain-containing protein/CheY-like chemotaxis protein